MKLNAYGRIGLAAGILGLIGAVLPMATGQAADLVFPSSSAGNVYVVQGGPNTSYATGTELAWNDSRGAYLSAAEVPTRPSDYEPLRLPAVSGATQAVTFISAQGEENDRTKWKAYSDLVDLGGKGVLLPQVTPGYQSYGLKGDVVKATGGFYSLGVAYVKDNAQTVVSAYFTTISVTPVTGAWKFASPAGTSGPSPSASPTATTTTPAATSLGLTASAAKYAGDKVTFTAKITPAAAPGSVQFYDGAKPIGTGSLAAGTATLATSSLAAGTHAVKAVYVANTAYAGSTSNTVTLTLVKKASFKKVGKVTVSGTAKVGKTLKAKVSGTWSPKPSKYAYQWLAGGKAISKATKSSYKIAKAYKGKTITVKVTATKTGYVTVTKTSKATKKVK